MTKKVVGFLMVTIGLFSLAANAQGTTVSSQNARVITPLYLNYMMGTVSVPVIKATNTNTPVIATSTVIVATTTATTSMPVYVAPITSSSSTSTCVAYLTSYHKYGDKGMDVIKLQEFLNKFNGAKLNGKGFYGPATTKEVQNLQYAYGIKTTGAQYQKTTDLINKINCGLIAKKDRVVYAAQNYTNSAPTTINNIPVKNIYPNAPQGQNAPTGIVTKTPTKPTTTPKDSKVSTTSTSTSSLNDSIAGSFKNDFDRIKENYKAYILVFVLVLALFWFLRKAATE